MSSSWKNESCQKVIQFFNFLNVDWSQSKLNISVFFMNFEGRNNCSFILIGLCTYVKQFVKCEFNLFLERAKFNLCQISTKIYFTKILKF